MPREEIGLRFESAIKTIALAVLGIYLIGVLEIAALPETIQLTGFLLLSPIVILVILTIHEKYQPDPAFASLQRYAIVFFIIAFAVANVMIAVQQAGLYYYREISQEVEITKSVYSLFNSIQLGLDVSFDVFYTLGMFLFSLRFLAKSGLALALGLLGLILSTGLLASNILTFPIPPHDAGLIDLGPYSIIWWLLLAVTLRRKK